MAKVSKPTSSKTTKKAPAKKVKAEAAKETKEKKTKAKAEKQTETEKEPEEKIPGKSRGILNYEDILGELDENTHVRIEVIANLFGVTARRIQQLTQDGVLPVDKGGGYRNYLLYDSIRKYTKYLSDKAYGKARTENEAALKNQKLKAEIALKESQGELHRLRTDIAAGKYISVEEAKLDYSKFMIVLKKNIMSIPNKVAGRIVGCVEPVEVRQIEADIQNELTSLLRDFVLSAEATTSEKDIK